MPPPSIFYADAVLFDMDGTLTDSIAAVEAAWGKVAQDIGQDPVHVVAATHGRRAIDNLAHFKPHLRAHEIEDAIDAFERTILFYADAHRRAQSFSGASSASRTPYESSSSGGEESDTPASSVGSFSAAERPSFATRLSQALLNDALAGSAVADDACDDCGIAASASYEDVFKDAWQLEAASTDRAVRILPGVKRMIDSLPVGRYAVATSGAKTYAHGCMNRVGIIPPPVTITADDRRLKQGKPAPDPFLLAAECLGVDARKCVVFEDSPSGIRSGVAAGAIVVAVCTSHSREKIEGCGAHYLVENMEKVRCEVVERGGRECLKFTVEA
ncbi:HAD-like domain-containing protein [Amylostereum chailletii]|nr:HAD-like domain-containing protein [Amylostereum chailletii]